MQIPEADTSCAGCAARDVAIAELQQQMQQMQEQLTALQTALARSKKDSSNSSNPPSSDLVKPPKPKLKGGRKRWRGGQPGHTKHERTFTLAEADVVHQHTLETCPCCGTDALFANGQEASIRCQYELVETPIQMHAHRRPHYWCTTCQTTEHAEVPPAVRQGGLVGPRLSSLIGYLKGSGHLSYSTLQAVLDDGLGMSISTGLLAKVVDKVSQALAPMYQALLEALPDQTRLHIDKTGHPDQGRRLWTWVFAVPSFTVFTIADSRSTQVLETVLGTDCAAVVGHDYFASYRAYMKRAPVTVQFCLAHLIRELRFIAQSYSPHVPAYGQLLLADLKKIFDLIHRQDPLQPQTFQRRLKQLRDAFLTKAQRTTARGEAATLAKRFKTHGQEYFTFITCPDIEPTNNTAEWALRFCVIDRGITQGTRGLKGQHWCERFWTIRETYRQQGRKVGRFGEKAVQAAFEGTQPPSLMPA